MKEHLVVRKSYELVNSNQEIIAEYSCFKCSLYFENEMDLGAHIKSHNQR